MIHSIMQPGNEEGALGASMSHDDPTSRAPREGDLLGAIGAVIRAV